MQELRNELDEKRREVSSLVQKQKCLQREISSLMQELESEFSSFNVKLDAMCAVKKTSEERVVENKQLLDQVARLENIAKEINGVEGVNEGDGLVFEVSKIKGLMIQVNHLKLNVDCMFNNAHKGDIDDECKAHQTNNNGSDSMHENLQVQVNKLKRELGSMTKKNTKLESDVKKKSRENSEFSSRMGDLKIEVASKIQEVQKMQKEKEDSLLTVKNLELEVQNLCSHRSENEKAIARKEEENVQLKQEIEELQAKTSNLKEEFERQIDIKNNDISRLTEDNESLQGRISKLEKKLKDRGDVFSYLQNDMSTEIVALTDEVSKLHREKDMKSNLDEDNELGEEKESLEVKILEQEITLTEKEDQIADLQSTIQVGQNEKSYLQGELSVERKNFSERLNQLENQNNELSFKLSDQQFVLKQQEETIKKLRADCKLMKGRFLQATERKMDEVAEEFRKNFEDKLRILSQRVRVSEQLHSENKENWKKMKEHCEQQHPGIQKRLAQVMKTSSGKAELRVVSQAINEMMKEMEGLLSKLESKECDFLERLCRVSSEIKVAKNWAHCILNEKKNEPPGSGYGPSITMEDKKQQDHKVGMKEKEKANRRLEANKVNSKEKIDKLKLMRGMYEMQKKAAQLEKVVAEKDEELLRLGNEKVEAIRQLCMWVDYRQNCFDHKLKEVMLVKKTKC